MGNVDLSKLSASELKELLAKKEKQEAEQRQKEIEAYEKERDEMIMKFVKRAEAFHYALQEFKKECHEAMDRQAEKLSEYGKMRSNSKGGFSITTKDGMLRITRIRSVEPYWDERSTKAVELIKDFLYDTVKKKDKKLFEILMSFIEKNKNGDLEYNKVMSLIQHEDKYNDPRWKEGLQLIKESFNNRLKGYSYEFKIASEDDGKWQVLNLNFTNV